MKNILKTIRGLIIGFTIAIIFSGALLRCKSAMADEIPHFQDALNCPANMICCPQALYCDYLTGCGDDEGYSLMGNMPYFEGVYRFDFEHAFIATGINIACYYKASINGVMGSINIQKSNEYSPIGSSWSPSFEKKYYTCVNSYSLNCVAKIGNG